jgi:hypothetical protein
MAATGAIILLFQPSNSANFTFNATFDGVAYNVVVNWNYWAQRYYVNVYTINGQIVYTLPQIGSPDNDDININAGYFTSPLIYRVSSNSFEIGP